MLIKALWNNALAAKAQLSKQSSFASLLNTNLPMGNKKGLFLPLAHSGVSTSH
jgi:ubiquitin carboxyl-terminal hydrolase 34